MSDTENKNIIEEFEEKLDKLEDRLANIESVLNIEPEDEDDEWEDNDDEENEDEDDEDEDEDEDDK